MEWVAAPVPEWAAGLERDGVPPWLAVLLARRGVEDSRGAERFLHPSLDQLHDPFLLAGMEESVARLLAARDRKEKVAVVGDYDVDGISATALLLAVFAACGIEAKAVMPNRLREGYGFQPVHVERARELGCGLIVTADCGSSSVEAVEAAMAAGIDVIVTDHHLPGCELPAGALHINPHQSHCTYPFRDLAAVGLAFKLALALAVRCGKTLDPAPLLRVACLGTIADLVPLQGENRVIAALGLKALAEAEVAGVEGAHPAVGDEAAVHGLGRRLPHRTADQRGGPPARSRAGARAAAEPRRRPRGGAGRRARRLEPRAADDGDAGGRGGDAPVRAALAAAADPGRLERELA